MSTASNSGKITGSADLRLPDELREPLRAHLKDLHERYRQRHWAGRVGFGTRPAVVVIDLARFWLDPRQRIGSNLDSVVDALAAMIRQATGTLAAQVRTAHRLTDQELKTLRRLLEEKFARKVELEVSVDPGLLGGFVAKVESEVYDASVAGKINKFRESLM